MPDRSLIAALAEAAAALHASARSHKRAEAQHRKQARELMRQLDHVQRVCKQHGIELHIDDTAKEAQS